METLSKDTVILLHKEGNDHTKKTLEAKYGKDFFEPSIEWMKLWESFCQEHSLTVVLPYSIPSNRDEESVNAYVMLTHIVRITRGNWEPDWNNSNQYKWYPYFKMSGFGFSRSYCDGWDSFTTAGSRLCFPTEKMADEAGKKYQPIYEKFLTQ